MKNLFAVLSPKFKEQSPLSTHIITNLNCNWDIYLFIVYLCSAAAVAMSLKAE